MVLFNTVVWQKIKIQWRQVVLLLLSLLVGWGCLGIAPALATVDDDHFDGNVFALYGSNSALATSKMTFQNSRSNNKPTLLIFYVNDSRDCKQFAPVVTQLQGFYGWATNFILVDVDSIRPKAHYEPTEVGYYYQGYVPQLVLLDSSDKVVMNTTGIVPFEQVDDVFREVFDLYPRSESVELKRRHVNATNNVSGS